jgi:AraC-like DNA-binding protein
VEAFDISRLRAPIEIGRSALQADSEISHTGLFRRSTNGPECSGWGERFHLQRGAIAEMSEWRADIEQQYVLDICDCLLALFYLGGASRLTVDGGLSRSVPGASGIALIAEGPQSMTHVFEPGYGQEVAVVVPLGVVRRDLGFDPQTLFRNPEAFGGPSSRLNVTNAQLTERMLASVRAMFDGHTNQAMREVFVESHAWLLVRELLVILSTGVPTHPPKLAECRMRVMASRAAQYMRDRLDQEHTLATIARAVGMSRSRLAEAFQHHYGTTVQAFLRKERMDRARALVHSGQLPIGEIARRVGYHDASSFTRAFHRYHRMTPGTLRRHGAESAWL